MTTIEEYGKQNPEMLALLTWTVETERNIEGLIDKLAEPQIVTYIARGTTAIKADLTEAQAKMQKAIDHIKTAIEKAEVDVVIQEIFEGKKDGK